MHEYSLVQALLHRVEAEARARSATAVHCVTVRIGPLAGVERELFATAYRFSRAGTMCDGARLVIVGEDVAWSCDVCGTAIAAGSALVCSACGSPARLVGGDALVLERIELEAPDV